MGDASARDAFDAWARPRLVAAMGYARRQGIDPEDIVQETLIRARERWPDVESPTVAYAWCRTTAARLVVDELRRPHRTREQPHADPAVSEHAPVLDGPEAAVVADLHIASVVSALDPRDRDVLAMRLRDLDPDDIARQLSISGNAARQALWRARRSFEKAWRAQGGVISMPVTRLRGRLAQVDPSVERVASTLTIVVSLLVPTGWEAAAAVPRHDIGAGMTGPPAPTAQVTDLPGAAERVTDRSPVTVHVPVRVSVPRIVLGLGSGVLVSPPPATASGSIESPVLCVVSNDCALHVQHAVPVGDVPVPGEVCEPEPDNPLVECVRESPGPGTTVPRR